MTTIVERLDLREYEAEQGWTGTPSPDDERVIDEEEVARLLLDGSEVERLQRLQEPAVVFDASEDRDGLSGMRGVMIGLAWVAPIWLLLAALFILT